MSTDRYFQLLDECDRLWHAMSDLEQHQVDDNIALITDLDARGGANAAIEACLGELQRQTGAIDAQIVCEAIGAGRRAAQHYRATKSPRTAADRLEAAWDVFERIYHEVVPEQRAAAVQKLVTWLAGRP